MLEAGILEPYLVKHWAIKLATNAAITVLRVDQVCTICIFLTIKTLTFQNQDIDGETEIALSFFLS